MAVCYISQMLDNYILFKYFIFKYQIGVSMVKKNLNILVTKQNCIRFSKNNLYCLHGTISDKLLFLLLDTNFMISIQFSACDLIQY